MDQDQLDFFQQQVDIVRQVLDGLTGVKTPTRHGADTIAQSLNSSLECLYSSADRDGGAVPLFLFRIVSRQYLDLIPCNEPARWLLAMKALQDRHAWQIRDLKEY